MQPNLVDHLAAFIAVTETGSFSIAARTLGRAVSSISYSLTQLETQCGFPLLKRGTRRSELTERGRALFNEAKAVVERARRFTSHAASLEQGAETRIRIAVDVVFPHAALHRALKAFISAHERVELQIFNSSLNNLWAPPCRSTWRASRSARSSFSPPLRWIIPWRCWGAR
jgi:DNA-binding transcriptional LysR family regulator